MVKPVRALVDPDIMVWARESAGYSNKAAAKKIGVPLERLLDWESEEKDDRPTINQLRKMARVYKWPLSVFYLSERPATFKTLRDYRRLPNVGPVKYSPELIYEQRLANERREQAIEMAAELQINSLTFANVADLDEDPEEVGVRVREILGVSIEEQSAWQDARIAFNEWRRKIEALGVLVFQMSSVPSDEASGFAVSAEIYPAISVNRKNTPYTNRIFFLFHEFAHLLLRRSGVSDSQLDGQRPPEEQRVEIWCNAVAAATLMPRSQFLSDELVRSKDKDQWEDADIEIISRKYGISREVAVHRLHSLDKTTWSFYVAKRREYEDQGKGETKKAGEYRSNRGFRRNPAIDAMNELGKPFVRLVLSSFYNNRMTLCDAVGCLNVKVKHLQAIEKQVWR